MSGKGTVLVTAGRASSAAGVSSSCCGKGYAVRTTLRSLVARAQLALPSASTWMYRIAWISMPRNLQQMLVGTRPPAVQVGLHCAI